MVRTTRTQSAAERKSLKGLLNHYLAGVSHMVMKPANAKQKQWMNDVAEWAHGGNMDLLYDVDTDCGFQLHHVLGRSAKHNKVNIGHWFIIPVPFLYHDINEKHNLNVSYFKHNFTDRFGMQRDLFNIMINDMKLSTYELPSTEVINSIMDTKA